MATKQSLHRSMSAIFCDDIRLEQGNKFSLMGVYHGGLYVADIPAFLPKLCVFITIVTPYSKPFEQLKVRLLKNDDIVLEHELPREALGLTPITPIPDFTPEAGSQIFVIHLPLTLTPFQIDKSFVLRVRGIAEGGEEIRCPGLMIRKVA